jgi:DNA helicase INO80
MKVCFVLLDGYDRRMLIVDVGEGHFDDGSNRPSGAATPIPGEGPKAKKARKAGGKKAKTAKQRLAMADGDVDMG